MQKSRFQPGQLVEPVLEPGVFFVCFGVVDGTLFLVGHTLLEFEPAELYRSIEPDR